MLETDMETNTASLPVDALVGCDRNGRVTVWNDRARELFGYSEADVLGHSYVMLMPIRFRAAHEQGLRRAAACGRPRSCSRLVGGGRGCARTEWSSCSRCPSAGGSSTKGTCIVGSIAPVLDEALPVRRRPEPDPLSFDRRIAEALPQLVWITNAPGQLQYCNRRWYDYFGLSEADLVQIAEKEVLLPQERPAWIEKWVRSLANGEPFEHECHLRRANGEARWFLNRSIPLRDENGVVKCWLGTSTDIHDQKLARQLLAAQRDGFEALVNERTHALRESLTALEEESAAHQRAQVAAEASERRLQAALDGARDFVWDYDCTTGVVYRSTGWSTMLGYGSAPFDSSLEHWREIAHPDDQRVAYASFRDFIEGRVEFHEAEYRLRNASGAWRWIASKGKIVQRDADGRPLRAAGTSTDITDRKHVAEALELAKQEAERASRAKSEFLENMSHELRTPLNSIIGFANVLRRNRAKTLEGSDLTYLERIHSNGVSLLRLIDDVLDIAKVEAGHMEFTIRVSAPRCHGARPQGAVRATHATRGAADRRSPVACALHPCGRASPSTNRAQPDVERNQVHGERKRHGCGGVRRVERGVSHRGARHRNRRFCRAGSADLRTIRAGRRRNGAPLRRNRARPFDLTRALRADGVHPHDDQRRGCGLDVHDRPLATGAA